MIFGKTGKSEDTYYGDGLNLYAYCHNNPVGYVDPSGHLCEKKQHTLDKYKANGLGKKPMLWYNMKLY